MKVCFIHLCFPTWILSPYLRYWLFILVTSALRFRAQLCVRNGCPGPKWWDIMKQGILPVKEFFLGTWDYKPQLVLLCSQSPLRGVISKQWPFKLITLPLLLSFSMRVTLSVSLALRSGFAHEMIHVASSSSLKILNYNCLWNCSLGLCDIPTHLWIDGK